MRPTNQLTVVDINTRERRPHLVDVTSVSATLKWICFDLVKRCMAALQSPPIGSYTIPGVKIWYIIVLGPEGVFFPNRPTVWTGIKKKSLNLNLPGLSVLWHLLSLFAHVAWWGTGYGRCFDGIWSHPKIPKRRRLVSQLGNPWIFFSNLFGGSIDTYLEILATSSAVPRTHDTSTKRWPVAAVFGIICLRWLYQVDSWGREQNAHGNCLGILIFVHSEEVMINHQFLKKSSKSNLHHQLHEYRQSCISDNILISQSLMPFFFVLDISLNQTRIS